MAGYLIEAGRWRRLLIVGALVGLGAFIVLTDRPAEGNTFGPSGCCKYADSSYHTWLESAVPDGNQAWRTYVSSSFSQDYEPTDMSTGEVFYHENWSLTYPYVDVSWWTESLPPPKIGTASCNKTVSGDTSKCDHWHVKFNYPTSSSSTTRHHTACHEIGHSVGLSHEGWLPAGSCTSQESSYTNLSDHDRYHINGRY